MSIQPYKLSILPKGSPSLQQPDLIAKLSWPCKSQLNFFHWESTENLPAMGN